MVFSVERQLDNNNRAKFQNIMPLTLNYLEMVKKEYK